jgi:SAM-dependent methyltransferase
LDSEPTEATLAELERKLEEEESVYSELLSKLDVLAANPAPFVRDPRIPELLEELNRRAVPDPVETPRPSGGLKGHLRRLLRRLMQPDLARIEASFERQRSFDGTLVQFLNRLSENGNAAAARSAEFSSVLVGFAQRIDRLADAKDRLYASLGNRRSDLLLEAMDKRLETVRLVVSRAQERLEGMSSAVALARAELDARGSGASGAAPAKATVESLADAHYLAFEERFRGSSDEIRLRLSAYVPLFRDHEPVLDLGCGRGEFLECLREAGIEGRGLDGNAEMVRASRERGLTVEQGDVTGFVSALPPGSFGGIFAAQLVEHLPPRFLASFLEDCRRALRPDGLLVLETVNPRSLVALVESFYRDLTHEKPLHPETLAFALRAAGFRDVSLRYSSPVPARARLLPVPASAPEARTLNQNIEKLNAFLYGDQDYAAIATK